MNFKPIDSLKYEEALVEMQEIISQLEKSQIKISDIPTYFKRCKELHNFCKQELDKLKLLIEEVEVKP